MNRYRDIRVETEQVLAGVPEDAQAVLKVTVLFSGAGVVATIDRVEELSDELYRLALEAVARITEVALVDVQAGSAGTAG